MDRNISLDILKIVACFSVVTLHVVGNDINIINSSIYYIAGCGVPIFFMVNGNLLLNKKEIDYKYCLLKVRNIIFIVVGWNLIFSFIYIIAKGKVINPFFEAIKNLNQQGYFYQFWFFGSLIIIYSILPILHNIFSKSKYTNLMIVVLVTICVLIDITSFFRALNGKSIIQINFIQTYRVWTWFLYFLLGGLIGKLKNYLIDAINIKSNILILIVMTVIICIYQYSVANIVYKMPYAEFFYDNLFTIIWILSIFLFIYRLDIIKENKYICMLRDNLIGIYIIHTTIIKIISKIYYFQDSLTNIIMVIIVFILSFILSSSLNKISLIKKIMRI